MGRAGHKTKVSVSDELLQPATNGRPQLESRQRIFLRRPGDVSIMWCCGQNQQFVTGSRTISIRDFGNQNSHFKPDQYFFWNPNQVVMCLNLIRGISTASLQRRDGTFYLNKHWVATQRNTSVVLQTRTQLGRRETWRLRMSESLRFISMWCCRTAHRWERVYAQLPANFSPRSLL